MTAKVASNPLIHAIANGFMDRSANENDLSAITWIQDYLFNPQLTQTEVNNVAQGLLDGFHSSVSKNDSKRYQFRTLTASDELLKLIFEEGFHHDSDGIIRDAQRMEGSLYPLWKRVCVIYIPKGLGAFLGHPLVKIALSIATIYYSYQFGHRAFEKMVHFFPARVVPFLINNTPIAIVHSSNKILNTADWVRRHKWDFLIYGAIAQRIILWGPTIPYFTAIVRAIDIWDIGFVLWRSSCTLFEFLVQKGFEGAQFVWQTSNSLSAFFNSVAIKAEGDCLAVSKAKAYAIWKRVIAEHTPTRA